MKRTRNLTRLAINVALVFLIATSLLKLSGFLWPRTAHSAVAPAQTGTIACGQTRSGNITRNGEQHTYTLNGNADEVVSIAIVATSGNLCAWAELFNPAGTPIGNLGNTCNSLFRVRLPATGTYTILVRDFSINRTGEYKLNLQFTTGRCADTISCGQVKNGEIAEHAEQDTYTFDANAGEVVSIAIVANSGNLCAWAELFNAAGTVVANLGNTCNSLFRVRLPATGKYTILVRDFSVNRTGEYKLNLQFATGRCADTIACGQVKNGEITERAEQDTYSFCGAEGSSVSIAITTTSGNLCAWAELFDSAGAVVGNLGNTCNSLFRASLRATGTYTILVRDFSVNRTGNYNLNLTCIGNTCPPPVTLTLAPSPLSVTVDSSSDLTASIGTAQSTDTEVTLSSSNPAVATVPASVTILANETSRSFPVMGVAVGMATVTARLPANLSGTATASVTVREPPQTCRPNSDLPPGFVPFTQIDYIAGPNAVGDRLVVGKMPPQQQQQLNSLPQPGQPEQRFCDPVTLAPGLLAIAYVPTTGERSGAFSSFAGLLLDPITNQPFPGGAIPANRLGDPHAWRIVNQVGAPALVSAASYSGLALASDSIAAAFGSRLATETQAATMQPLPTELASTSVRFRDSLGKQELAGLFFVSENQVNFQVPPGLRDGAATVTFTRETVAVAIGTLQIATVAPGLFAANANGQGVAAGSALRVKADGTQVFEPIAHLDQAQAKSVPIPIDLGSETEQVFLLLFGTGLRQAGSLAAVMATIGGQNAEVLFAGRQGDFVGLDQLNLRIPRSLAGRGEVDVVLKVADKVANIVRVSIK